MNLSRVAAKQLTASDLTFFSSQFHKPGQRSKQKAINLNANVFVSQFYPGLRDRFAELHFGLTIIGPGAAPPYVVSRKALRTEGAKNWRLNGELINDPADQPGRFDNLGEGDIAILAFEGNEQPQQVTLVLVSAVADAVLHKAASHLAAFHDRETMRAIDETDIRSLLDATPTEYPNRHPFESLLTADSVEEAIYGPVEESIRTNGRGVAISPESIRRQAVSAGETGQLGEEAFERWLASTGHTEMDFEWVSQKYGRAAFDFELSHPKWESGPLYIDVKTTRGSYNSTFHMSAAELRWAAHQPSYRIARLSLLTASSAELRILSGISELASNILHGLETSLPSGVKIDSMEISPLLLQEIRRENIEWKRED